MKMKEVQLLAILAVIAGSIIALSMWGGTAGHQGTERGENGGPEQTIPADGMDEFVGIIGGESGGERDRRHEPADGESFRELVRRETSPLRGSFHPLAFPPGESLDDKVSETEPEEIPLETDEEEGEAIAGDTGADPVRHTVERGDTLSEISQQYYGTSRKWKDILEANKDVLQSPERLTIGMSLRIPDARQSVLAREDQSDQDPATLSTSARSTGEGRKYTVQKGDTLWSIAVNHYDDGTRYNDLIAANDDLISDGNDLHPGMVLLIPE